MSLTRDLKSKHPSFTFYLSPTSAIEGQCSLADSVRDRSLITGRGGGVATKWENRGSETFCAPTPEDRVKLLAPPLLKSGNISHPPPTIWLKL